MNCEIVTIGSELLLGQIVDTNAAYLGQTLNTIGIPIIFQTTVGDVKEHIKEALVLALKRANLVITTGGIGPTEDDLTRQVAAEVLGAPLDFRQDLMDHIETLFKRSGYHMVPTNRRQAYIPKGSTPIMNPVGTAPGFIGEKNGSLLLALPGVPRELKYLMKNTVVPYLKEHFKLGQRLIYYRVLKVTGLGESGVDNEIGDLIKRHRNPEVGLLASPGHITIRITAHADNAEHADSIIRPMEEEIRSRLGTLIFGTDDDTLEKVVEDLLVHKGADLSLLETFTGGLIGLTLSRINSSAFKGSCNFTEKGTLNTWMEDIGRSLVSDEDIAVHAAKKLSRETQTRLALVVYGFPQKVNERYRVNATVAVAYPSGTGSAQYQLGGDRMSLSERGAAIGLNFLRKTLLDWDTLKAD